MEEVGDGQSRGPLLKQGWWWFSRKSCPTLVTPWTVAHQAPLSMGFSGQEYWSGLPFPSPGDLPDPGIKPRYLHCRLILYQLSCEGGPLSREDRSKKEDVREDAKSVPIMYLYSSVAFYYQRASKLDIFLVLKKSSTISHFNYDFHFLEFHRICYLLCSHPALFSECLN